MITKNVEVEATIKKREDDWYDLQHELDKCDRSARLCILQMVIGSIFLFTTSLIMSFHVATSIGISIGSVGIILCLTGQYRLAKVNKKWRDLNATR